MFSALSVDPDDFDLHSDTIQSIMNQSIMNLYNGAVVHRRSDESEFNDQQVAQLSRRNHAAGWISFGWVVGDGVGQTIPCTKRCRYQKTNIINVLADKSTFIRKEVTLRF